ncbi:hypothetical protein ABZ806_26060 [Spirillospora sp. NPDC047418]
MIEASIFPSEDEPLGWVIVIALAALSLLGFMLHACITKKWRTHTFLDAFFDRRRVGMVEAYFGSQGSKFERSTILVQFLVGSAFGLWAIGALLIKVADRFGYLLNWLGVALWVAGVITFLVAQKRARFGQPERVKPKWLREEEMKRERGATAPE